MDTTADLIALEGDLAVLDAEMAATDARLEALLARPIHRSLTSPLAALQAQAAENTAALDAIEAEQAEIERQIEELEQAA